MKNEEEREKKVRWNVWIFFIVQGHNAAQMILTVYERSSLRMQICRIRRWRRMRWRRVTPVIRWERIFAGWWRRWLIINDSGATPGGPAARRRPASPAWLLIAIVLPEKIPLLWNVRRQSKECTWLSPQVEHPPHFIGHRGLIVCTRYDEDKIAGKRTRTVALSVTILPKNRSQPWQESNFYRHKRIIQVARIIFLCPTISLINLRNFFP